MTVLSKIGAGLLKVGVSLACLLLVWRFFAPKDWPSIMARMDPGLATAALASLLLGQVFNGWRHWAVLAALGRRLALGRVLALASAGMFFSQILPSGMGGDVVRTLSLKARCGWRRSIASVVFDRMVGLALILVIVSLFLPFYFTLPLPLAVKITIAAISLGPLAALAVALPLAHVRWLRRRLPRLARGPVYGLILLGRVFRPAAVLRLGLPLVGSLIPFVVAFGLLGESLGGGVGVFGYLSMVPLIFLTAQAPISFGGWGVREGAAVGLMPLVGMDPGLAVLASTLFGAAVLVTSLPGLAIWASGRQGALAVE
ncbi:MAG: hypothetical protein GC191_20295 [Azospirillum sp.]|nr:hypothetical protein [Azospirillum sp.]